MNRENKNIYRYIYNWFWNDLHIFIRIDNVNIVSYIIMVSIFIWYYSMIVHISSLLINLQKYNNVLLRCKCIDIIKKKTFDMQGKDKIRHDRINFLCQEQENCNSR